MRLRAAGCGLREPEGAAVARWRSKGTLRRMDPLEFREVSLANLDEIAELRVRPDQTHLVADNLYSIAQAGLDPTGFCRGVYVNGEPAGFFFVRMMEGGRLAYICRFMVDQQWQGHGNRPAHPARTRRVSLRLSRR